MKYCKYCGKILDDQANFCPYCMKQQREPAPAPQIKIKKRFPKGLLFALLGILAAAGILVTVLLLPGKKQEQRQTQSSAYDLYAQFGDLLGTDLETVQDFFGAELAPATVDQFTGAEAHYFSGIEIDILPSTGKIVAYTIDYEQSDPPHRYNYRGIDGSASYQDVVALLGLPSDDSGYPFEVTYAMKKGYMKFSLDEDLKITKIFALFPLE